MARAALLLRTMRDKTLKKKRKKNARIFRAVTQKKCYTKPCSSKFLALQYENLLLSEKSKANSNHIRKIKLTHL